jgi:hypothetical protein
LEGTDGLFKKTSRSVALPHQYGQGVEEYGEHLLRNPNGNGFNVKPTR